MRILHIAPVDDNAVGFGRDLRNSNGCARLGIIGLATHEHRWTIVETETP
jgi:hypothetical protein